MTEKPPLLPILHLNSTKKEKLKALVFFSGYGLASYAFTQENFDVIGGIEYEAIAAESYLANFPNSKVLVKSTRELTGTRIANYFNIGPGELDVIEIGFPCPKISSTGPREQFHAMNDQFAVATKLALSLKPKVLLYENVPNITSEAMSVLMGMINSLLKNYAPEYRCEARILDSWLYGDYTSRPRWYLMAVHEDYGYPQWPEPLPESQRPVIRDFLPTAKWVHTRNYGDRYMIPSKPISTITGHCDFKMLDMDTGEKRLLTVRERATAMGLPDDFILLGNQEQQGLGVGNGNAVMVTRKLARCIREIIEDGGPTNPVRPRRNAMLTVPESIQPNDKGYVVYQGPSAINGEEIVAIVTMGSDNPKTGDMTQLWILSANESPLAASKSGGDSSVCGGCTLRHHLDGACYVNIGLAPEQIWKSWKRGIYPVLADNDLDLLDEKPMRLGAYGDPAALPMGLLQKLTVYAPNHTSYSHQWMDASDELKEISMASVESIEGYQEATSQGWRTYRIIEEAGALMEGEIMCPAITNGTQCADCKLCSGNAIKAKNIAIPAHGSRKGKFGVNSHTQSEPSIIIKTEKSGSKSLSKSKISWTDYTWNPWVGCHKCSAGCKFCYMHRDMVRWGKDPDSVSRTTSATFRKPLKIKAPSKIFLNSWSDFFIEEADDWRPEVWQIIKETPWHTYQILTKRPERILQSLPDDWGGGYPNVWLGVSVENQEFTKRVKTLVTIPAAVRFISAEPLLGPVDFNGDSMLDNVDWIIIGGESGNNKGKYTYRPCEPEWIRSLIEQGASSNTAVFVKQTGTHLAMELELKSRHGSKISELPEWMQIQEFPTINGQ